MEFPDTEVITGNMVSRFEQVVRRFPQNVALKSHRSELTYEELDKRSNAVAGAMLKTHKPRDRVGLLFAHGVSSMVAQVGALKGGFPRIELSVSYPKARLREMVNRCQIRCILTRKEFKEMADEVASDAGVTIFYVEDCREQPPGPRPGVPLTPTTASSLSFSSGSTGEPKLKEKNHLIELHSVMRVSASIGLTPGDRMLFTRSATVIPFHALLTGACYYPADIQHDGDLMALAQWIREERITVLRSPVSIFRALMHMIGEEERFPHLRLIVLQGEPVYRADVEAYRNRFNDTCVLVSTLGVSEYGDFAHYFLDKDTPMDHPTVPGGYPLQGVEVRLITGSDVPEDAEGEIGITGPFMERMVPPAERYVSQAGTDGGDATYYLTGDFGAIARDGCIFHRGRKDFQVKIRGNRVNLLEVDAALLDIDGVSQAAAAAVQVKGQNELILVGFLESASTDIQAIRHSLEARIPAHLIPSRFVFMEFLPRTLTGKIDRRSLPPLETNNAGKNDSIGDPSACTEIERQVLEIWKEVLQWDHIGIHDPFLDCGGDSLKAMMMLSRLNRHFAIRLSVRTLFDAETVSQIAEAILPLLQAEKPASPS